MLKNHHKEEDMANREACEIGTDEHFTNGWLKFCEEMPLRGPCKANPNRQPEYIYFIKAGNGLVKIGAAANVQERFKTLKLMSPVSLSIVFIINETLQMEKNIHRMFKHLRKHGEWFIFNNEIKHFIKTYEVLSNENS
jgi:hypothetical protein